jgi:hypothetical protein
LENVRILSNIKLENNRIISISKNQNLFRPSLDGIFIGQVGFAQLFINSIVQFPGPLKEHHGFSQREMIEFGERFLIGGQAHGTGEDFRDGFEILNGAPLMDLVHLGLKVDHGERMNEPPQVGSPRIHWAKQRHEVGFLFLAQIRDRLFSFFLAFSTPTPSSPQKK